MVSVRLGAKQSMIQIRNWVAFPKLLLLQFWFHYFGKWELQYFPQSFC